MPKPSSPRSRSWTHFTRAQRRSILPGAASTRRKSAQTAGKPPKTAHTAQRQASHTAAGQGSLRSAIPCRNSIPLKHQNRKNGPFQADFCGNNMKHPAQGCAGCGASGRTRTYNPSVNSSPFWRANSRFFLSIRKPDFKASCGRFVAEKGKQFLPQNKKKFLRSTNEKPCAAGLFAICASIFIRSDF